MDTSLPDLPKLDVEEWVSLHQPRGILFDACGVFLENASGLPLPSAQEALAWLKAQGIVVGVLSNASAMSARALERLAEHGWRMGEHFDFYLTSGQVAAQHLASRPTRPGKRRSYWELGQAHPQHALYHRAAFAAAGYEPTEELAAAECFVCHIPHKAGSDLEDAEQAKELFLPELERAYAQGLPLISINPDLFVLEKLDGPLLIRQGLLARWYADLGGTVLEYGKPSALAFEAALHQFALRGLQDRTALWMLGDNPETDLRGARAIGMPCALVCETGLCGEWMKTQALRTVLEALPWTDRPDAVVSRIAMASSPSHKTQHLCGGPLVE